MKFSIKTLSVLLASILSVTSASEATAPADSAVVKLTSKNFESFIESHPLVLAEFFAPWCGHCKTLAPEYVSAAEILSKKDIPLAQIDCTEDRDLCTDIGIKGFPTLKIFKGSLENPADYLGARKSDSIISYMVKQSLPPVQLVSTSENLDEILTDSVDSIVLQIINSESKNNEQNQTYYDLAGALREKYTFLSTSNAELIKKYNVNSNAPTYLVYRPKDPSDPSIYNQENDKSISLEDFISSESKPFFGEIDGSTYQEYMSSKLPLAYYFYEDADDRAKWEPFFSKLGKDLRSKLSFVGLDSKRFGRHAENLNMPLQFPLFVIHNIEENLKYGIQPSESKQFTESSISTFIDEYLEGKIEPTIKSEEIPEVQENNVYKLVAKTHNELINDSKKDIFVKYYAPWCGHCKKLAPIFEELAGLYKNDAESSEKVLIAELDATLNDVNVEISGYPTLILYPANDKENPIVYSKGRDLESFIQFIKESGSNKVDASLIENVEEEEEEEEVKEEVKEEAKEEKKEGKKEEVKEEIKEEVKEEVEEEVKEEAKEEAKEAKQTKHDEL
ncbi:protein disulfide isomerase [Ascoidea rubescens DSM 1968]|uniref:protein disulfide-isomerase n=1 Tax=Ascoidea rubescens DSM 1968 TaxID=1344418 RepID=A0A1D2VBI9_9ASCO|nr:protein disulfide isomerase [Ascoidea rubescens DSM 1968]ODV58970.1 protein disulfide isomerase [Ascoidea rubescens DSM 1968]